MILFWMAVRLHMVYKIGTIYLYSYHIVHQVDVSHYSNVFSEFHIFQLGCIIFAINSEKIIHIATGTFNAEIVHRNL